MAGAPVRRAPYKDFLQPALQRRFASTATVLLIVSYVEAVLISQWDSRTTSLLPKTKLHTDFGFQCYGHGSQ